MRDYLRARLNETSTWRNAVLLVGAVLGISLEDQEVDVIVSLTIGIAGFIGVITPDKI